MALAVDLRTIVKILRNEFIMKFFLQMICDPFKVVNLREELDLECLPWIFVLECLKFHLLCNIGEFAAKLAETLFIQGTNRALILASH